MQYIWQHRLYRNSDMVTNDGLKVRVIDPGLLNTDAGPDFFNAKIEIDGHLWAGNVELHVRATDWKRHGHDRDKAYDSVILHVVGKDDAPVYRTSGERIPQVVLEVSPLFNQSYDRLVNARDEIPCAASLRQVPHLTITEWVEALAFERLARRTPLRLLAKHSDSLLQVEALLFGQAGLLDAAAQGTDSYYQHLCSEYAFLANKFQLRPMERESWKLFRIRPQNFPYRRIAMLAHYIEGGFSLMSKLLEADGEKALRDLFTVELTGYWANHYSFGKPNARPSRALSDNSIDIVLINTVSPLYCACGEITGESRLADKAIALLESLKSERNAIVDKFTYAGIDSPDALTSQALIELKREYCEARKCIYCKIGHYLLSEAARSKT